MKTSSAKAKEYKCDCGRVFSFHLSHNSHRRWCGKAKGWIDGDGYRKVFIDGVEVREHRLVVEEHIGRKLTREEHIHHINGDRLDNRISNLEIIDIQQHGKISGPLARGIPKPGLIGNTNGVGWQRKVKSC